MTTRQIRPAAPVAAPVQNYRERRDYSLNNGRPRLYAPGGYRDVITHILYDTLRFKRGLPIEESGLNVFAIAHGNESRIANGTDKYVKNLADTNLERPYSLAEGEDFLLRSIQLELELTAMEGVDGSGDDVTIDTDFQTPLITSAAHLLHQVQNTFHCEFQFGSSRRDYEKGLVKHFPSEFGASGFAGGVAGTAVPANSLLESIVQNGFGRARKLANVRQITGLQKIKGEIRPQHRFIPNRDFQLRISLVGELISPA